MIPSPITGGLTHRVSNIPTAEIIAMYAPYTSVVRFFTGLESIDIYECKDTGYQFYYPFSTAGDGKFYEELSKESLYYLPWKQEHVVANEFIKSSDSVLELGCAGGDFLFELMKTKQIVAHGTEINEVAKNTATAGGVKFTPIENADVTCAFQVLEHIADVKSFIQLAINSTKTGGYIIFSVPDNASLIRHDSRVFLNMPPHHMGLWTPHSLQALANYFPLSVVATRTECLQPNHYRWYYQMHVGDYLLPLGLMGKIINKIIYELIAKHFIRLRAATLTGHTVVAVFKKT